MPKAQLCTRMSLLSPGLGQPAGHRQRGLIVEDGPEVQQQHTAAAEDLQEL